MYKFFVSLFLILAIKISVNAQGCDCESNFVWLKKTVEENDAGFQYVINKKGEQAYNIHNQLMLEKIKIAKEIYDCAEVMKEWLSFFRKWHIGIEILPDAMERKNEITKSFIDWETVYIDTIEFKKYLDNKTDIDFEGIWNNGIYRIGVKKIDSRYIGFIVKSQIKEWETGQIKCEIYSDSSVYYMRDHSAEIYKHTQLPSKNFLLLGSGGYFRRDYPQYQESFEDKYMQSIIDEKPYIERLNKKTLYVRIPSFSYELIETIDSIIHSRKNKITKTKNLIIDLRFNGGGSDGCWQSFIPYIYTNPIRLGSCYYLSSELNNQEIKRGDEFMQKLTTNLNKFVLLHSKEYFIQTYNKIYKKPQNVAIIVNKYCGSSTESFLLAAKQSKKVKIFGEVTIGALDFSNVIVVKSPCNDFELYYATSKDVGIDVYPIDDIGIQPDFYLDSEIPDYQWIDYVNDILNNRFK